MLKEMKTGIFFHPIFAQRTWSIIGDKYRNFPQILKEFEGKEGFIFYPLKPISEELLLKVHTKRMLEVVKRYENYQAAIYAGDGCVQAIEKIWIGEINNGMVFLGSCHHASRDSAWGGCAISGVGAAIVNLREKFNAGRFAILDTDAHHGDGARAMHLGDKDVLHVCFCHYNHVEDGGTKVDVEVGWRESDADYLKKIKENFIPRVREFKPDMIIHHFGHDTAEGDYGDLGLSKDFYIQLAKLIKGCADEVCQGKYLVMTGGGARRDIAEYIYPRILHILAGEES